jgi:hypothetical protein
MYAAADKSPWKHLLWTWLIMLAAPGGALADISANL